MIDQAISTVIPGLYIHIPFCRTRCNYCSFATTDNHSQSGIEDYVECLIAEITRYASTWHQFDTVYFGGGTPSLLAAEQIRKLLLTIRNTFDIETAAEITLEVNPGDVTDDLLEVWHSCGVNRISLGVQALDDVGLKLLGRRHNTAQALKAIERVTQYSMNLSLDFIYGFPGHTQLDWMKTLEKIGDLSPDHLSCYQLSLEPETPLHAQVHAGTIQAIDDELEESLYHLTHEALDTLGYDHYEISSYAKRPGNVSRHNTKYWIRASYLGLGAGAHSFDGRSRWDNLTRYQEYCQTLNTGNLPINKSEKIAETAATKEAIFLGLRTRWGVATRLIPGAFLSSDMFHQMKATGWLRLEKDRLRPTSAGLAVADYIASQIISEISDD